MQYITEIEIWWTKKKIIVKKLTQDTNLNNISRVYVIACNNDWNIWLIYNSKYNIRWFPWWHKNQNEDIIQTANREYIEEMWYDLSECTIKYVIENQIESDKIEKQVICFWRIGNINTSQIEAEESVTEIWFFWLNDIVKKIWNKLLWEKIVIDFSNTFII